MILPDSYEAMEADGEHREAMANHSGPSRSSKLLARGPSTPPA